ncbi:hypothetical protein [Enterococcus faecium]|uniref:hypothetical protein n=1 Tax=Enterococcus faecium TaxID=1352 RepID=UPI000A3305B1|nr:hypothetical protein [Enterococcus faecium]OTN92399.1 hypothetical protein A5809_001788 [Enterococcus faecium]
MAINNVIDLDAKLSLTKSVKIAGKVYEITISDEVDQALTDLTSVDVPSQLEHLTEKAEKLEDKSTDKYKEFIRLEVATLKDRSIAALDKVLGEGEGTRVYKSYGNSTKALLTVIGLLQKELSKLMIERKKTADNYYKNKHKKK